MNKRSFNHKRGEYVLYEYDRDGLKIKQSLFTSRVFSKLEGRFMNHSNYGYLVYNSSSNYLNQNGLVMKINNKGSIIVSGSDWTVPSIKDYIKNNYLKDWNLISETDKKKITDKVDCAIVLELILRKNDHFIQSDLIGDKSKYEGNIPNLKIP